MNEMTPKTSRAAQVGLSLSIAGAIIPLLAFAASLLSWMPGSLVRGMLVVAILLCPIVGMAVSLLAKRDIERSSGQFRGGGLATAGALISLLDLLLARVVWLI